MNLEEKIVFIVFFLYAYVAASYAFKGNWPWFIVWGSYAMANLGLILATRIK
jgi:hypothetical protein